MWIILSLWYDTQNRVPDEKKKINLIQIWSMRIFQILFRGLLHWKVFNLILNLSFGSDHNRIRNRNSSPSFFILSFSLSLCRFYYLSFLCKKDMEKQNNNHNGFFTFEKSILFRWLVSFVLKYPIISFPSYSLDFAIYISICFTIPFSPSLCTRYQNQILVYKLRLSNQYSNTNTLIKSQANTTPFWELDWNGENG